MGSAGSAISQKTQANFDPARYSGAWYEVARCNTVPAEKCCTSATAEYAWDSDKCCMTFKNTCYTCDKPVYSVEGVLRIPQMCDAGKMVMKFMGKPCDPCNPCKVPEKEVPYWVFCTDYDNFAIVGTPCGQHLWVLSRTPQLPADDINMILTKVKCFGFDPCCVVAYKSNIAY